MTVITTLNTKIRILTPEEFDKIILAIEIPWMQNMFKTAVYTGMRYTELETFFDHPEWFDQSTGNIQLPVLYSSFELRASPGRLITPISSEFVAVIKSYLGNQAPPTRTTWNEKLKRWAKLAGLDTEGISNRMTRATLEAWMIVSGIITDANFCSRQGYDRLSILSKYNNIKFSDQEKEEIIKRLKTMEMME